MGTIELPTCDERSIFNVVEENFQKLGLKNYVIRMLYCGEHNLPTKEMVKHFRKTVNGVNAGYCEVNVYGILLMYERHFIHVLEGSEDTVHRQLRFLFQAEEAYKKAMEAKDLAEEEQAEAEGLAALEAPQHKPDRNMFRRLKCLMVYHSIKTRRFTNWRAFTANPPVLVSKLDQTSSLPEHMEQLRICIDKLNRICQLAQNEEKLTFEGLKVADPKMDALPEVALLEHLISSPYILNLRAVFHMHRRVDDHVYYHEMVWPLGNHFTPRYLYKLKVDDTFVEPLPVMPWELVAKEKTDKEDDGTEREDVSDSDD